MKMKMKKTILTLLMMGVIQGCSSDGESASDTLQNSELSPPVEVSDDSEFVVDPGNIEGVNININGVAGRLLAQAPPASSTQINRPVVFSDPGLIAAVPGQVESVEIGFTVTASLIAIFVSIAEDDQHIAFDLPLDDTDSTQQIVRLQVHVPTADETFCYSVKALDSEQRVSDPTQLCLIGSDQSAPEISRTVYFADYSSNSTLSTLSVDTGEVREIGRTGVRLTDVGILDGSLYGVSVSSLYSIDPSTGASQLVGRMGSSSVNALVGFNGTLYAANRSGQLLRVDPTNGASEVFGDLAGGSSSGDLVPTEDSTALLGTVNVSGSSSDWLMRHDLTTGTSELIGDTGFEQVWGLAFFRSQLIGLTHDGELLLIDPATGRGALVDQTQALSAGGAAVDTELLLNSAPTSGGIVAATFQTLKPPVRGNGWRMVAGSDQHDQSYSLPELSSSINDIFAYDLNKTVGENTNADKGALVTPVFEGQVIYRHSPLGFILVEHTVPLILSTGEEITPWYSGYMHMTQIPENLVSVNVNTKLGEIADIGVEGVDHLHFSIYRSGDTGLESIDIANDLGSFSSFIGEWSDQCGETPLEPQSMAWWAVGSTPCL